MPARTTASALSAHSHSVASIQSGASSVHPPLDELADFAPVSRPKKLREQVLEQLRTAILTGALAEGTIVSAPALGQSLGVSATPVREAMMDLSREGLVDVLKNRGFRIATVTDKDLDDLAEIRKMIEGPATRELAGKVPAAALPTLRSLADSCLASADAGNLEGYLRYDREFHAFLLSFTGNTQLVDLATSLRMRSRLYGISALARQGVLAESAREHHLLIELIEAGDADAVEELIRQHISHARSKWATGSDSTPLPASSPSTSSP